MNPTIGRIVHYVISEGDAQLINKRRGDFSAYRARHAAAVVAPEPGEPGATGHIGHVGNYVAEGDIYPAMVVRNFGGTGTTVNLKVQLDGDDTYWATSRTEGDGPGRWHWPDREEGDRPASQAAPAAFRPDQG